MTAGTRKPSRAAEPSSRAEQPSRAAEPSNLALFVTALTLLTVPAEGAQAQTRYDVGGGRMGTTDASSQAGVQPRVWLVTIDHELISKRIDLNEQAWTRWNLTGMDEDIDAVSWTSGATQLDRNCDGVVDFPCGD